MLLSIVIPAYNEETRIGHMLRRYLDYSWPLDVEYIVVLNGCRDRTLEIVQSFSAEAGRRLRIITISEAIGKGGAVRQGFTLADGDYIGFADADGATEPGEFNKLIQKLPDYDGVIASRWKRGSQMIGRNFMRKIISLGFIVFVKLLFWMPFFDTQCGAKVFKKNFLKEILPRLKVDNMAFDVELLYRARQVHGRIAEVPTKWINRDSSAALGSPLGTISSGLRMLFTLMQIRLS
jgi:glycosyltransferase involved in cell wall biosynthesis